MKNTEEEAIAAGAQSSLERLTAMKKKGDQNLHTINKFCIAMSNHLIEAQRYEIYLGLKKKWSRSHSRIEIDGQPGNQA